MKKTKFKIKTKDIFLTYSKCPLGKDKIHNHIKQLMASKKKEIQYLITNQENHKDHKEIHSHVLFQLTKSATFNGERFFDIEGFHPEIEVARDIEKSISYIKKDGDFIEEGTPRHKKYVRQNQKEERKQLIYDEIFRLKNEYYHNEDLTLQQVKKTLDEFIINLDRDFYLEQIDLIEKILKKKFIKKDELALLDKLQNHIPSTGYDLNTFKFNKSTQEIENAIVEQLKVDKRPLSIVIEGASRLGKTEFIISYLNNQKVHYNYIRGSFDFSKENYNDNFKVDVYDDISINYIKSAGLLKNIIGGQGGFIVDVKYSPKRLLSGNKLSIFLVNPDISFESWCEEDEKYAGETHKYIKTNCIFIYVPDKLY
uniref:Replication-associated protein n=1 Tax=Paulownia witches'-broom phytoplasma TaxID=39647 RepID=B1N8W4_9MOLU|nr:replication-associated protein [Paulownia witches'-broom phytoplasma]ABR08376.1 replication-associated protein [Paulownia witches'-broom phytoplasma]